MTTPPQSGDELPSIAERVTLALYLLYPDTQVDDLNEVAAAHINESHPGSITADHIAALRAGDLQAVPAVAFNAFVAEVPLTQDALFGSDTDALLPIWSNLQLLARLREGSANGLLQLRAGTDLSAAAREALDALERDPYAFDDEPK